MAPESPAPLWTPGQPRSDGSRLAGFLRSTGFARYGDLWEWSVGDSTAGPFWQRVADHAGVEWYHQPVEQSRRGSTGVAGATWFPGGRLNYAERCLRPPAAGGGAVAVKARSQTRPDRDLTWDDLRALVGRVRAGLLASGVGKGDRVAGYLPNIPETLALMLASASLGAVWTCCAPEMGVSGCLDRLAQTEPVVLVAVDGYRYGSRAIDRREEIAAIRRGLPSVQRAVFLPYLDPGGPPPEGWVGWEELVAGQGDLEYEPVPFDHPLYILYSSGTTGPPKAIVHGHGGILLEHAKALSLHFDIGADDVFFWFTTTGWMMWNFCVSGLLVDSAVVLYDGDPAGPGGDELWRLMASTGTTCGGVGAGYLVAGMKAGHTPGHDHDLSRLATLGSTGSPLPPQAAAWVYEKVSDDVLLASFSGGTDVCTGFVGASPMHPVWAGEISCRCLGAAVEVFDDEGRSIVGEEGELVLTRPLPSMPVAILGDPDGSRYRATYFDRFPGVWAHGDRATLTERGSVVITGRSDGTLNRGGVRMGTAEFYAVVEALPEVADSLVVHVEDPAGGPGELMLFVVPAEGMGGVGVGRSEGVGVGRSEGVGVGRSGGVGVGGVGGSGGVDEGELADRVRAALRRELSPRHVPDVVEVVPAVPRTLSGKKLEVPVKRILGGVDVATAVSVAAVANPESLLPFVERARRRPAG